MRLSQLFFPRKLAEAEVCAWILAQLYLLAYGSRHLQMQIGSLTVRATLQPRCQDVTSEYPLQPQQLRVSKSEKRQARKVSQEARMTEFLVKNHFFLDDINEPRGPGRHDSEQLWPIHGAAELGDGELLRSLLRARADSTQVP